MNKNKIKDCLLNDNFELITENNLYDTYLLSYKFLDLKLHITDSYIDFIIYNSSHQNHIYFKSCNIENVLNNSNIDYFIEDLKKLMIFIFKYVDINFTCIDFSKITGETDEN